MALSQRDIVITPNRGASTEPTIRFTGADASSSATITLRVINSSTVGTLSFEGTSGQLFSVTDSMVGTIFSVNDVSGIPSIEVVDTGLVKLAQYNGAVTISTATSISGAKLTVQGGVFVNGTLTATNFVGAFTGAVTGPATQLNATANTNAFEYIVGVAGAGSAQNAVVATTVPFGFNASTGLVGIGTVSPNQQLTVQSDMSLYTTNDTAGTTSMLLGSSTSMPQGIAMVKATKTAAGAGYLTLHTASGGTLNEVLRVTALGGISFGATGTAVGTAGQVLQSNADAAPTWVAPSGLTVSTANNAVNIRTIQQTANASYFPTFVNSNNAANAYELVYTTSSFVINPGTGNVGFGTTVAPALNGKGVSIYTSDFPRISFRNSTTGDTIADGTQLLMSGSDFYIQNQEAGALVFNTTSIERLRITATGGIAFGGAANYGTSGYVLKSNGNAAPTWVAQSTLAAGSATDSTKVAKAGDTMTGGLTMSGAGVFLNRNAGTTHGLSWYASSYTTWSTFMGFPGNVNQGPTGNITPAAGAYVTSWALRNTVESNANFGFTWESGTSAQTTPSIVAELRSSDGLFHAYGNIYKYNSPVGGVIVPGLTISDAAPTGTVNAGDLWWESDTGRLKIRYFDGTTTQWVDVVPVVNTSLYFLKAGGVISGPVSINGVLDVTGNITATGEITAYYSDRRLKTDIITIENAVLKVKKLTGVTYRPNELAKSYGLDTNSDVVGLFADEVNEVLPQAVKPAPFDIDTDGLSKSGENYKTIQYEKIVPLLVEAIKEQQVTIEAQQAKIDRLMKHLGLED